MTAQAVKNFLGRSGYTMATIYLGCAALTAAICYVDLLVPRGIAIGTLYIIVVLFSIWGPGTRFIAITATVASLLVVAAFIINPPVESFSKALFNRIIALTTIWTTALLGMKMKQAEQELIRIASHDFLTGLLNRREMFNRLNTEICRVDRVDRPFSLLMIDIDHFKRINDSYGHVVGDRVLRGVAGLLREHLREYDYLCRYGGEEFLVAAPETPLQTAQELGERLRRQMEESPIVLPSLAPIPITVSVGVTELLKGEPIEATLSRADQALYLAKELGRNRVELLRGNPA